MRSNFKHPKIYNDTIAFYKLYRQAHKNLPKDLRLTTGEQILTEITTCLGCIAAANFAGKSERADRLRAASQLTYMRERLEVIRAFLVLAWEEKAISHHQFADLSSRLDELGKQATRWRQWFEGTAVGATDAGCT